MPPLKSSPRFIEVAPIERAMAKRAPVRNKWIKSVLPGLDFLAFPELRVTELKDIGRDSMVVSQYCRKAQAFLREDFSLNDARQALLPFCPSGIES